MIAVAAIDDDEDDEKDAKNKTVTVASPRSVYRRPYGANTEDDVAFALGGADGVAQEQAEGMSLATKTAGGGIAGGLVVIVVVVIVVLNLKGSKKERTA